MQKKAVILFSGGLDSTTCLALAKEQGFDCYALSFNFGQKHSVELESAKEIAKKMGVIAHQVLPLALNELGGSALTDTNIEVYRIIKVTTRSPVLMYQRVIPFF